MSSSALRLSETQEGSFLCSTGSGRETPTSSTLDPVKNSILADDVSPEMFSCCDPESPARTPHLDALAREGTVFRTCFSAASCGPSRALLMTGVYGNRTGVFANDIRAFQSKTRLFTEQVSPTTNKPETTIWLMRTGAKHDIGKCADKRGNGGKATFPKKGRAPSPRFRQDRRCRRPIP